MAKGDCITPRTLTPLGPAPASTSLGRSPALMERFVASFRLLQSRSIPCYFLLPLGEERFRRSPLPPRVVGLDLPPTFSPSFFSL